WQGIGNGRLLLLSSDRGITLPDALIGQDDPLPNLHGSFSLMVNYHAIGQYVELEGGLALNPTQYQDNLQVAAFMLNNLPQDGVETQAAFDEAVGKNGPDDFFALRQAITPHLHTLTLPQLLSYLRLNVWDADIFRDCYPTLLTQIEQTDPVWYPDVYQLIMRVWEHYLPLTENDDLTPKINRLFDIMGYKLDMDDTNSEEMGSES
ncbi:MAG: hypothetical protein GY943_32670, partial [Chloroflexi bacterium]|nr:hypothetical protein [Chloroflexota bacterium]